MHGVQTEEPAEMRHRIRYTQIEYWYWYKMKVLTIWRVAASSTRGARCRRHRGVGAGCAGSARSGARGGGVMQANGSVMPLTGQWLPIGQGIGVDMPVEGQ